MSGYAIQVIVAIDVAADTSVKLRNMDPHRRFLTIHCLGGTHRLRALLPAAPRGHTY